MTVNVALSIGLKHVVKCTNSKAALYAANPFYVVLLLILICLAKTEISPPPQTTAGADRMRFNLRLLRVIVYNLDTNVESIQCA